MKTLILITSIVFSMAVSGCSNSKQAARETDDIYFTRADRAKEEAALAQSLEPTNSGANFEESQEVDEGYFMKGSSRTNSASDSTSYYSADDAAKIASQSDGDVTINNFYGNTNYYEDDGYGTSYATQIRRFNTTNVAVGYAYYDPYFVDPYWNYGWSYWDPWYSPGWSLSYNSWYGWNVGYNYGWCARPSYWYSPYYAYGPYYGNYWGTGYYGYYNNPWAYNNYWNGYNNGYYNGYYDGLYSGNYGNNTGRRGIYEGRRGLANETGFVSAQGRTSPNADIQEKVGATTNGSVAQKMETPYKQQTAQLASTDRLNKTNQIYQAAIQQRTTADVKKASPSSLTQSAPNAMAQNNKQPVITKIKYEANELARTPVSQSRYPSAMKPSAQGVAPNASGQSQTAPYTPSQGTPNNAAPMKQGQSAAQSPNASQNAKMVKPNYYRAPERQQSATPQRTPNQRTPSAQPAQSQPYQRPVYQRPSQGTPSRDQYTPNAPQQGTAAPSRSVSPSRTVTPNRTATPNRSVAPSRTPAASPTRSASPAPSPSRNGGSAAPSVQRRK